MRISDYLSKDTVVFDIEANDMVSSIDAIVGILEGLTWIKLPGNITEEILKREKMGTTALGNGTAIPHARLPDLNRLIITIARMAHSIPFGFENQTQPVQIVFLILTPEESVGEYLKILARLSKLLKESDLRAKILSASSAKDVLDYIEEMESQFSLKQKR
jgi:nitrogen PTS system EIIA component